MIEGKYHCELGDLPAKIIHEIGDATALSVEFPDRVTSIHIPTNRLSLVFTENKKTRTKSSVAYGDRITKAHKKAKSEASADSKRLAALQKAAEGA